MVAHLQQTTPKAVVVAVVNTAAKRSRFSVTVTTTIPLVLAALAVSMARQVARPSSIPAPYLQTAVAEVLKGLAVPAAVAAPERMPILTAAPVALAVAELVAPVVVLRGRQAPVVMVVTIPLSVLLEPEMARLVRVVSVLPQETKAVARVITMAAAAAVASALAASAPMAPVVISD